MNPTHVVLGREKSCKCCTSLISVTRSDFSSLLREIILSGRSIHVVTWQEYTDNVRHEVGFMNCAHEDEEK